MRAPNAGAEGDRRSRPAQPAASPVASIDDTHYIQRINRIRRFCVTAAPQVGDMRP